MAGATTPGAVRQATPQGTPLDRIRRSGRFLCVNHDPSAFRTRANVNCGVGRGTNLVRVRAPMGGQTIRVLGPGGQAQIIRQDAPNQPGMSRD